MNCAMFRRHTVFCLGVEAIFDRIDYSAGNTVMCNLKFVMTLDSGQKNLILPPKSSWEFLYRNEFQNFKGDTKNKVNFNSPPKKNKKKIDPNFKPQNMGWASLLKLTQLLPLPLGGGGELSAEIPTVSLKVLWILHLALFPFIKLSSPLQDNFYPYEWMNEWILWVTSVSLVTDWRFCIGKYKAQDES